MRQSKKGISSLRTVGAFLNRRACSNTLFHVLNNQAFDHPLKLEERAVMPLAGGIMQHGYQCGMIWGAVLAAGAQAYRLLGSNSSAQSGAIRAAKKLVESFQALNDDVNCLEITEIDKSSTTMQMITYFIIKGGSIKCFRMAAKYAPVAFRDINTTLDEKDVPSLFTTVSCASLVAERMGFSEMHKVMVAGLAGGIGLSGGACGALGASIWLNGLRSSREGAGKIDFKNPQALETINSFLKCSGYEFECSIIAGRKFVNIDDHAKYLNEGGCSKITEVLAGK